MDINKLGDTRMFTDSHRVDIYFDYGDWHIEVMPCVGRGCYLEYDIQEDGRHTFNVSVGSAYFDYSHSIDRWINEECDYFLVNGHRYFDLESASKAMWEYEIRNAQSTLEIEDILECVEDWPEVKRPALTRKCRIATLEHIKLETERCIRVINACNDLIERAGQWKQ